MVGCFCTVTSRGQGRASCMRGQQYGVVDSSTGSNSHRAARFSDAETADDDDDDDEEDDNDDDYSSSSSGEKSSEDEFDVRRRSRRSQGNYLPVNNR